MKCNTRLLTEQVRSTLIGKCTTAVITEAFINALPFNKDEMVFENLNLANYAANVISTMHPETLLDRALESTKNNPNANLYIKNLKAAIESVVTPATKRIVEESYSLNYTAPEIISKIKLNDEETEKFVNASKKAGTDAVAKLVKEKIIETIKDEKTSYEEEAKLHQEIKDIINQEKEDLNNKMTDDLPLDSVKNDEEVLESYFNLVLAPTDARHHTSLFSKMQDVCMEAIMYSTEKDFSEIPYKTLEKITTESTFPFFDTSNRSLEDALESLVVVAESALEHDDEGGEGECDHEEKKAKKRKMISKTAFICTICIMTLLQTLKSMNLAKPSVADVKKFVDDNTSIKKIARQDLQNVEDKVGELITDGKKSVALGAFNEYEINQVKESLEKVKGILEGMTLTPDANKQRNRIINKINSALESLKVEYKEDVKIPNSFTNRLREENLSALEHAMNLIGGKPLVSSIQIPISTDMVSAKNKDYIVEIRGLESSGMINTIYNISLHADPDIGESVAEIIHESAKYCDFGKKPVSIKFLDRGYSVEVEK